MNSIEKHHIQCWVIKYIKKLSIDYSILAPNLWLVSFQSAESKSSMEFFCVRFLSFRPRKFEKMFRKGMKRKPNRWICPIIHCSNTNYDIGENQVGIYYHFRDIDEKMTKNMNFGWEKTYIYIYIYKRRCWDKNYRIDLKIDTQTLLDLKTKKIGGWEQIFLTSM